MVTVSACIGVAAAGWASRAAACSVDGPPPSLSGYPEDGASGVPTDVIPVYDTPPLGGPQPGVAGPTEFHLRRASDGEEIPMASSAPYWWTIAFTPEAELEPNSEYVFEATVRAHPAAEPTYLSATFTTGDGPAAPPAPVAGAFMENYVVELDDNVYSTCGASRTGTCVVVPPGSFVTATFVDTFNQENTPAYLYREPFFTNLSGIEQGTNFKCVRLRTRAPNGTESEPVELCGADAPLREHQGSNDDVQCTATGVSFSPGENGGCGCAVVPARNDATWWSLAALLAAAATRRRRRP